MVFQKERTHSIPVPAQWQNNNFTLGQKVVVVDCMGNSCIGIISGMEYIHPEDYCYESFSPKEGWEYKVRVLEDEWKFVEPIITARDKDITPCPDNQ